MTCCLPFVAVCFAIISVSTNSPLRSCTQWMFVCNIIFGVIWYMVGCYFTWTSVHNKRTSTQSEATAPETKVDGHFFADEDDHYEECTETVLWFSLAMTLVPILLIFFMCCAVCIGSKLDEERSPSG